MLDTAAKATGRTDKEGFPFTKDARHLTEDIHEEILLRLPAQSVLRFRAVCKAWRRITTDPRFIAARALRRPAQALLYTYLDASPCEKNRRPARSDFDVALDVTPVSGEPGLRRRLIRYPQLWTSRYKHMSAYWLMLASCNGVLLFKKDLGLYLLCNPVTRQWAQLPRLADELYYTVRDVERAFYFHRSSGEYRLLCGRHTWSGSGQAWCVLSSGAAEPRRADSTHVEAGVVVPCLMSTASPPAALHDRLHWAPYHHGEVTKMVTFDTVSETFRSMEGPPTTSTLVKLFVMDGQIVVADFGTGGRVVDLWFLVDYGTERWERLHQVAMPWGSSPGSMPPYQASCLLSVAALADDQGNIMLGSHCGLVVYNARTKTARRVNSLATTRNNILMSRHVFRENLVQLPCVNVPAATADLPLIRFWN